MKRRTLLSATALSVATGLSLRAAAAQPQAACGAREAPVGPTRNLSDGLGNDDTASNLSEGGRSKITNAHADVIIIGSGAAGLSAAIAARRTGAKHVVVLEKALIAGGHTMLSSGSFSAVQTPAEIAGLVNEMLEAGRGACVPELVRTVAEGSWAAKRRLAELGVPWGAEPFRAVGSMSPRSWSTGSPQSGYDYIQALMSGARKLGVDIRFGNRVDALILDEPEQSWLPNRVTGVRVTETKHRTEKKYRLHAPAVVIATGGYTANKALLHRFAPKLPLNLPTTANPNKNFTDTATGDGILMALEAKAALRDMDALQVIPFSGGRLVDYVGAEIWLNAAGERFISEGEDFETLREVLKYEPGAVMWAISDARSPKGATLGLKLMDGTVSRAATLEEVANNMRVSVEVLKKTLDRYNRSARSGWDEQFNRPMRARPIETPPYFFGKEIFSLHYSCGGIAIDEHARVLDEANRPLPGLFAAGETTGGVHGRTRVGGCAIMDACVFGDIAGQEAALRAAI